MEKTPSLLPGKASSFSSREEKKSHEPSRNLSMQNKKNNANNNQEQTRQPTIEEELKEEQEDTEMEEKTDDKKVDPHRDIAVIYEKIDEFLKSIVGKDKIENIDGDLPEVPETAVVDLATWVEEEVRRLNGTGLVDGEMGLLDGIDRISKLTTALGAFPSEPAYGHAMTRTASVLQRAMAFLEEEFRSLLEGGGIDEEEKDGKINGVESDQGRTTSVETDDNEANEEVVGRLMRIAGTMISAGYETECCQVFSIARRAALGASLSKLGFEKTSTDELQKMSWESLEGRISTWINAFRHSITASFSEQKKLCERVFSGHPAVAAGLFSNLARSVIIQLLNFAEGVTMTKRSGEKLFKFLDMYETMKDLMPVMDGLFPVSEAQQEEQGSLPSSLLQAEMKNEMSVSKGRIGEAIIGIFSDLEASIKSETGKTPVPGGAVHPLTRFVMNYLKYACEYKNTLEQIYQEHNENINDGDNDDDNNRESAEKSASKSENATGESPFATQLHTIMDLLDSNLDSKSKLYKDTSLTYIFLMNNGRYIAQKLKGWLELNELLGETWCRKRSSDLRQYHKNYQRETWGRVLGCFKEEGLHPKGGGSGVLKPALKERFKAFNAMFDDIHKTQSAWVVSDEQLQSELRVSVSAVVVPAYRSFLGRYRQHLDSGRQAEKYIKYAPEDLETYIDDLFDGNPASIVRRKT